jgi:hypothetical protein
MTRISRPNGSAAHLTGRLHMPAPLTLANVKHEGLQPRANERRPVRCSRKLGRGSFLATAPYVVAGEPPAWRNRLNGMFRTVLLMIACVLISYDRGPRDVVAVSSHTDRLHAGKPMAYSSRRFQNSELPELATIAAILDDSTSPRRYRRVTINGCYTVDPYHGAVLVDNSGRGLMLFGGSDDVGDQPFDWTRQNVCGTFVATIYREPPEAPLKYLCPEVCAVGEGTVASTIVEIDNQTAIEVVR